MTCRIQTRSSLPCASLGSEVQEEKETDTLATKPCQKELVESSMVEAIYTSSSSSHAASEELECEQESSSSSSSSISSPSSPSEVIESCTVDGLDSDSNPWIEDDSATDHQEAVVTNGNIDGEVKKHAVGSCSDVTASVPSSCSKPRHPVRDADTKMIGAQ